MSYLDNKGVERLWAHITAKLGDKVTKEEGKGLSSNDFTTAEKTKLANLTAPSITSTGAGNAVTNISVSGSTFTVEKNADFLTEHPYITKYADTSSTASPAHSETFTAVDSISRDENGHVEKINVKTVTLPEYTLAGLMGSTAKGSTTLPVYWTGSAWATITSYSGKASTAGTADKVANALSINGKTYDGSAAIDVGVIDAAHGGTGQTSLLNSANALINALDNGTSTPVDADYFITGGATTYHRRPMSALYTYMKGKMDSIYQAKGTVPMASSTALGGVKVGSGLTIASDGTLNHSNSITAKTAYGSVATTASADGGTITLTDVQYDAQGHITGSIDRTITLSQRATTLEELGIDTFDKLNTKYGLDDKYKVTPDWNENDSTSKNYIKNRPGGYFDTSVVATTGDLTVGFEGVENTSAVPYETGYVPYPFGNEGNNPNQSLTSIIVGQSYTVVWNGTTYSNVIAKDDEGTVYLGEAEISDNELSPSFSNYPFFIILFPSERVTAIATPPSTSARSITFSISGYNIVKIPEDFLDFSALRSEYVRLENGSAYNLHLRGDSYIAPSRRSDLQSYVYFSNWLDDPSDWTTSSGLKTIGSITFDTPYGGNVANPNEGNGFFLQSYCYEQDTVNKEWVEAGYIGLRLSFQAENPSNALYLQYRNKNNEVSTYSILTEASTIPITSGGTGATTAAGALTALGAAAATHNQSASTIVSGMFPSWVKANTNAMKALSTAQLRNITISTTDLVEGESTLAEGEIYLVYDGGEA